MWPHSFVIAVNGTLLTIGTDDPDFLGYLRPWVVDEQSALVDFGLQSRPPQPENRAAPRLLPSLKHGSDVLARSDDVDLLRAALLRMITAATTPTPAGMIRVSGAVLERDGGAYVVPEGNLRSFSYRALARQGVLAHPGQSVLLDTSDGTVQLDVALGSTESARRLPLRAWLFNHREPAVPTTVGEDVARVLANLWGDGQTEHLPEQLLASAASLVLRVRPRYIAFGRESLENELTALFGR